MLQRGLLLVVGLFMSLATHAQVGKAVFEAEEHDFGKIAEQGGSVSHTFTFTNTGDAPLVLQSVSTSCGCTASEWSNTPVLPGAKGSITATYNPQGRPGVFVKTISVRTNGEQKDFVLRIRGTVTPRVVPPAQQYPQRYGDVGLRGSHFTVGQVWKDSTKSERLELYNHADRELLVRFEGLPPHVSIKPNPAVLSAQSLGHVTIAIDGRRTADWGLSMQSIRLATEGAAGDLTLVYSLEENFAALTHEAYTLAPRIAFEPASVDLGEVKKGKQKEAVLRVGNMGHQPLSLRKVVSSCSCLAAKAPTKPIPPGEWGEVHLVFRGEATGEAKAELTIISNDPTRSVAVTTVVAQVR